jgi:hypothetical protein
MLQNRVDSSMASAELSDFLSRILLRGMEVRAVWSVGHGELACDTPREGHKLLIFADTLTLHSLRRTDHRHRTPVQVLVVFDGDQFESAWGPHPLSGSLARWAWRQVAHDVAYYDESRWAEREDADKAVVRIRRKALLLWRSELALQQPGRT